ncbi:hypothetical protein BJV74DRAFT_845947 [Russula compacta]|nr:hypothetical protein BJV74DRAFT_845947 [Russula compacta]
MHPPAMASFLTTSRKSPDRLLHVTIHGASTMVSPTPDPLPRRGHCIFFPLDEPGLALYYRRHFVAGKEFDR